MALFMAYFRCNVVNEVGFELVRCKCFEMGSSVALFSLLYVDSFNTMFEIGSSEWFSMLRSFPYSIRWHMSCGVLIVKNEICYYDQCRSGAPITVLKN